MTSVLVSRTALALLGGALMVSCYGETQSSPPPGVYSYSASLPRPSPSAAEASTPAPSSSSASVSTYALANPYGQDDAGARPADAGTLEPELAVHRPSEPGVIETLQLRIVDGGTAPP